MTRGDSSQEATFAVQLAATRRFASAIGDLYRSGIVPLTAGGFAAAPQRLVARVCLARQEEALLGGLAAMNGGLLHHAAAQVRPACDELIWLEYIAKLEPTDQRNAILYLGAEEMTRSVNTEATFLGPEGMKEAGYPSALHRGFEPSATRDALKSLQDSLGWPSGKRPPSTAWVAKQTEHVGLYDYLYSATSRFLHFSVSETVRRGWTDGLDYPSPDTLINIEAEGYTMYRAHFAMYWLPYLFVLSAGAAIEIENQHLPEPLDNASDDEFMAALKAWRETVSRVPIIRAEELYGPPSWRS